jgi:aminoglycoside phosphotransferase family enzyme/predicted kinase
MPTLPTAQIDHRSEQCGDPDLLAALAASTMYRGHPPVVVHETHASWVFVAGDRAYKIKKPVTLGFLDYSTLSRRHAACLEEVRINQELAPGIYLGVRAILKASDGFRFAVEDTPGAIEYAVAMQSFREGDTFAGLIAGGALTRAHVAAVARLLADFHRSATVVEDWGPDSVLAVWRRNVAELQEMDHPAGWRLDVLAAFGEAFVTRHAPELRRRALLGLARDGHGDLRCEHVLAGPTVRVVDRIEFDPQLRRTDVACDLAFLAMDLEAHGQRWAARELLGAYRHAGISPGGEALRSFYAAHWALVRAKVALIAAAEHDGETDAEQLRAAQQLWSLSERLCWRARAPLAIVICGPAASGKSTLAGELSRRSEMEVVSSDAVRKRLARLDEHEPARTEHYSARFTRATYEQLGRDALLALRRTDTVIVDATCRARGDRVLLLDRLRRVGMTRLIVRCEVPLRLALERAAERLHDPQRISDATPQIAEEQFRAFEEFDELPYNSVLRLDTAQVLDTQIAEVTRAVDRRGVEGAAGGQSP